MLAGDWARVPPYFITSSLDAVGREPILEYINGINEDLFKKKVSFKKIQIKKKSLTQH